MIIWMREHKLFTLLFVAFIGVSLFGLPSCQQEDGGVAEESADNSIDTSPNLTYLLDWTWTDAQVDETGWRVTNDLGYEIQVTDGYLVSRSAELIPCRSETASLFDWLVPAVASAGHSSDESDESIISGPYKESLIGLETAVLDNVYTPAAIYCQAHYLLAEGIETATNMSEEDSMIGKTLWLQGTYELDNEQVPFTIESNLAWGINTDIVALVNGNNISTSTVTGNIPVTIMLTRSLGTIFNGVDFINQTDAQMSRTVLRTLANDTVHLCNKYFYQIGIK